MSLPYYKRYPRDFLEGTIGLSFEEKGAYAVVLDLIYMRDGQLADDARYIAGQLGCSVRKWNSVRGSLVRQGHLTVSAGVLSSALGKLWTKRPYLDPAIRAFVLERDGYTCTYCGDRAGPLEVDHILAVVNGGEDGLENLCCSCRTCNRSKGAKTLEHWVSA